MNEALVNNITFYLAIAMVGDLNALENHYFISKDSKDCKTFSSQQLHCNISIFTIKVNFVGTFQNELCIT